MRIETLTELQYSDDRKGPLRIYVFGPAGSSFHFGGIWFERKPRYPEEGEITTEEAERRFRWAMREKREVRICNGGDMLVLHAKEGKMIYPETAEEFWGNLP